MADNPDFVALARQLRELAVTLVYAERERLGLDEAQTAAAELTVCSMAVALVTDAHRLSPPVAIQNLVHCLNGMTVERRRRAGEGN